MLMSNFFSGPREASIYRVHETRISADHFASQFLCVTDSALTLSTFNAVHNGNNDKRP
jgi:hypothetical protein